MNRSVHSDPKKPAPGSGKVQARTNDPERTMADILAVATREFAEKGLAGARIDDIAEAMRTSKRMIYYYFGSKEGLYIRVLEEAYRLIAAPRPTCTWTTWSLKTRCADWSASPSTTSWPIPTSPAW
jgi:AcrR family transcriptional regulator